MDPQACLDILSQAAREHSQQHARGDRWCCVAGDCNQNSPADAGYPLTCPPVTVPSPPPPAEGPVETRGQVIDIETGANETLGPGMTEAAILELFPLLRPPETKTAEKEAASGEVGDKAADLVLTALACHEERVAVYKEYDAAFKHLIEGEGGGPRALAWLYPFIVKCATHRFQALSQSVRTIAAEVESISDITRKPLADQADEAARSLRGLQRMEAERLQLVAAHHAEQGRLMLAQRSDVNGPVRQGEVNACIASVADYRRQLVSTAEEINELASELKYAAAEMRP
eukprot:TRINITY_DN91982_c0_g1_i1.p1 TRINITY_DN91982_c0_g1~~TRINITY_DN91982_c0_g1_i1.p1  ORF type:complete len:287 (+),score=72.35 TRINITY_DN91982_c0_g1_i1:77-937(+)